MEYRAERVSVDALEEAFDVSFTVANHDPDAPLRSWQMSWSLHDRERIARGDDGGWLTALRGGAAMLVSPGDAARGAPPGW